MLSFKDTLKLKEANLDEKDTNYVSKFTSLHTAWEKSKTSRWMLNYLKYLDTLSRKQWVELALAFAERALPKFEAKYPNDSRPREALEAVKAWLENPSEENKELCRKAADAAANAAANTASDIAYAAFNASNAVSAYAVSYNAFDAAAYAAAKNKKQERLEQAKIIKARVPNPFILEHERLGLDKDAVDPWKDILEEL